jgi:hypothetical protein
MLRTLALALSLAAVAETASAQGFIEQMARQAAQAAAEKAARAAMGRIAGAGGSGESGTQSSATAAPARRTEAPAEVLTPKPRAGTPRTAASAPAPPAVHGSPSGPAPWPVNAASPDVKRPGDLEFSAEMKALATAFDAFGRVSCSSCEGGRSYDSWARKSLNISSDHGAWDKTLGALAVGQTLNWTGVESKGRITVVGETPVSDFRCKQLKWELSKGSARAERPGLVCFGYSGPYAASESWTEVF